MNFLLIDDTPESIRRIQDCFEGENMKKDDFKLYWIDETGNLRSDMQPKERITFPSSLDHVFYENIKKHINKQDLFLIDLSLTADEDDAFFARYSNNMGTFHAETAMRIIRFLKKHDPATKIKVISRTTSNIQETPLWHEIFSDLVQESWFGSIDFFLVAYFEDANNYAGIRDILAGRTRN